MTMDLFPTLLRLAGSGPPEGLDGMDVFHTLLGSDELPERPLFWRFRDQKAARLGPWKYIWQDGEEYLFNLQDDPGEIFNQKDHKPDMTDSLRKVLYDWEQEIASAPAANAE